MPLLCDVTERYSCPDLRHDTLSGVRTMGNFGVTMMALPDNLDQCSYLVTKHSWKGRYKRIFSFGTCGVTTYNPENLAVTNTWLYSEIASIRRTPDKSNKFILIMRKKQTKKTDSMNFSTEHRDELLSVASTYKHLFMEKAVVTSRYEVHKHHWSGILLPVLLDVSPTSLNQLDLATNVELARYYFKDIEGVYDLSDVSGGFIVKMNSFGRLHLFVSGKRDEIKKKMEENAHVYLGVNLKVHSSPVTMDVFHSKRLGDYNHDEHTTSLTEFNVEKTENVRHQEPTPRLLCLSQSCLIERDPETYQIITIRPLSTVFALVRDPQNPRLFKIEYVDGSMRAYNGSNRDSVLSTILDSVRGTGNKDVHVKIKCTRRGLRLGPYHCELEEEVEAAHLKLLRDSIGKKHMPEMLERFNANVPYSGLLHSVTQDGLFKENKERPIMEVLQALTARLKDGFDVDSLSDTEFEALYHAIRRLVASKIGFQAFTQLAGLRECLGHLVVKGLNKNNEAMTHAAIDMICALMHPMHDNYDLKQEQLNKSSLLGNTTFLNSLLDKWSFYVQTGTGALVVCAVLDMLTFSLCHPYCETTEGRLFDALLDLVVKRGRSLFKHFQHPCLTIVKGASLVMRAIIEEAENEVAARMQQLALCECALLRHLLISLYTPKSDHPSFTQCQISRQLVALWLANNDNGSNLMRRILPSGLLAYLDSKDTAPSDDVQNTAVRDNLKLAQDHAARNQRNLHINASLEKQIRIIEKQLENTFMHWGTRIGIEKRQDKFKTAPVVLRKSRQKIKSTLNWALFYYNFNCDHSFPNLIWNHKTRDELRYCLEKEIKAFDSAREITTDSVIAWNYEEFSVTYPSLKELLCIDGYYIRVLIDNSEAPDSLKIISSTFFNNLYHRFLLSFSTDVKCMCLQALAMVYERYYETIGFFADTKYIVDMLERSFDRLERDRLLIFLYTLTFNKRNVEEIVYNSQGLTLLVDLMSLAHLHTSRAVVPTQSNVIEFGSYEEEQGKEWHYCSSQDESKSSRKSVTFKELKELYAKGAINGKTKCWAQGMYNWKPLQTVTQLKWCLVAKNTPILNESDLATLILKMLINMINFFPSRNPEEAIVWPMSKVKQVLSEENCIQHVVQLLLTYDPVIVEKVATLLCSIAEDNVLMPKFYLTGVFFFILMYNGSNVLPIAKFLKLTHTKQAFRGAEECSTELMQRSILGQLLPEAMVYYLENHGPEKFAQIFLGEYDTPEAIWNSEMRCMLIQKIAAHIADFTPRLWSNNKAFYQYIIIPVVRYPQLANELFCNIFYLRHLCDTKRFPDWPINDPVTVLRDVLELWTSEVEKKPPAMSVDDAYAILELAPGKHHDEPVIRKAYYRLAQMYHPDKNSEGRLKFEAVNKAYDFLCSHSPWMSHGVNTNNIVLILQTQCILFYRYSADLRPYKYAGYKQLLKTIRLESQEERLFSKQPVLLASAVELIHHTIVCSPLNAEEFNREQGFELISDVLSRCVSVLSKSTKDSDIISQISSHCVKIFIIAASFENCRESFKHLLSKIAPDLLRILHFKNLVKLSCAAVDCVSALAVEPHIQIHFWNSGILWYLLSNLFLYDYTLEESGIESAQDANQQEAWNEIAKLSIKACARISGYQSESEGLPHFAKAKKILSKLLTPFLASALFSDQPELVLKMLTSNCETPYLLWDNSTRAELLDFLDGKKLLRDTDEIDDVSLVYSRHSSELIVGDIFIRVYNDMPTYKLTNAKGLLLDVMEYLRSFNLFQHEEASRNDVLMVLTALYNVINNNPGIAIQCIGHFKLLFSYLSFNVPTEIKVKMLSVISLLSRNHVCVNDIAASGVLIHILLLLHSLPSHLSLTLDCVHALITSSDIVKDLVNTGCIAYIVDIVFNSNSKDVKVKAAEILGRLIEDRVSGPKIKLSLCQFFPAAICEGMQEAPTTAITLLETDQENPEIIWNENDRKALSLAVSKHCREQFKIQVQNPSSPVALPNQGIWSSPLRTSQEPMIGGVYLKLFNKNPAWSLRKPVQFLRELLDAFLRLMTKSQTELFEEVGTAIANVISYNSNIANEVPSLGHLPKMFFQWKVPNLKLSHHVFLILNQLFESEACVISVAQIDVTTPMKNAMSAHPELINIGCDTLKKMYEFKNENLVKQALESGLVQYLLKLLDEPLSLSDNPSRTKAIIVKTLKSMRDSAVNGPTVAAVVEKSPVWSSYKEQNHDLFITVGANKKYVTGGVPQTAGYLTQGSKPVPSSPPPIKDDNQ